MYLGSIHLGKRCYSWQWHPLCKDAGGGLLAVVPLLSPGDASFAGGGEAFRLIGLL